MMPSCCTAFSVFPFLSLKVKKQISPVVPWVGSEVSPYTGRHAVTGLGHLDFSPIEQMLAAAV